VVPAICIFAFIGAIRIYTYSIGMISDQRFTKDNYFKSLTFWDENNYDRWFFSRACEPHGDIENSWELLSLQKEIEVTKESEFILTAEFEFPKKRMGERYFVKATFDKRIYSKERFKNVFLVIDAYSNRLNHRYYKAMNLYNDIEEGRDEWKTLVFESQAYDYLEEYDHLKVYIWNSGKHHFKLRNVRLVVQSFK